MANRSRRASTRAFGQKPSVQGAPRGSRGRRRLFPSLLLTGLVAIGAVYVFMPRESKPLPQLRIGPAPPGSSFPEAPAFSLRSADGSAVSLQDYRGRNVLLFFQEGVGCPPCWQQNVAIEATMDRFRAMDIRDVLTIVVNPLEQMREEYGKWKLTLPVLSDADLQVSRAYDTIGQSMHPGRVNGHTFILVDGDGLIRWRKDYYRSGGHMGMGTGRMYVPMEEVFRDLGSAIQGA